MIVPPDAAATGLSDLAVQTRVDAGQVNTVLPAPGRSLGQILRANVLTRFNAILGSLFVVVLVVGPPQDALFGAVLVVNTGIGVAQELRAKRALDRLGDPDRRAGPGDQRRRRHRPGSRRVRWRAGRRVSREEPGRFRDDARGHTSMVFLYGNAAYPPGGTVPVGCRCRPRWTALSKTLTPRPRAMRSAIIWPVTTSRATSVLAVMSPNPTVANTVTVK